MMLPTHSQGTNCVVLSGPSGTRLCLPWLLLVIAMIATLLLYLPTLSGPLILDSGKLYSIEAHWRTHQGCADVPRFSGISGRSLSLFTFCLNIAYSKGLDPASIKLTNVLLHIANGILVFLLLLRLGRRAMIKAPEWSALVISVLWLSAPIHFSTIPYAIQRMTILCTTFSLVTMLLLVTVLENGNAKIRIGSAIFCLLAIVCAFMSKETGALTPFMLGLIYYYFYAEQKWTRRSLSFAAVSLLALATAVLWICSHAGFLDYRTQNFTLYERLLTETRGLWYYVQQILLPSNGDVGVFQDDFVVSRGWLNPPTTLLSGIALLCVLFLLLRSHSPIAFGGMFFLAGHLLESTVIPLEPIFLHRNYLPSVGLLAAVVWSIQDLTRLRQWLPALALLPLFALIGIWRADNWSEGAKLFASSYHYHPNSPRAAQGLAQSLLDQGKDADALAVLEHTLDISPQVAASVRLQQIYIYCRNNQVIPAELMEQFSSSPPYPRAQEINQGINNLLSVVTSQQCPSFDFDRFRAALEQVFSRQISNGYATQWDKQYYVATSYIASGHPYLAVSYLDNAFQQGEKLAGYYLLDIWLQQKQLQKAREILEKLRITPGVTGTDLVEFERRIALAEGAKEP